MPGFQLLIYLQNDPHSFFPLNSLSFLCFFSLRSLPYPVRLSSPQKNEDPLPAFTCPLFFPSCKSFPVPTISQSPSSTTTMARWWCPWPHVPTCSAPPETSPHSSKMAASFLGIVTPGKKKMHGRKVPNGGLQVVLVFLLNYK